MNRVLRRSAGIAAVSLTLAVQPVFAQSTNLDGTLKIWAWADWAGPFEAIFEAFKKETGSTATMEFLPLSDFNVEYNLVVKEATCDICFNFITFDSYRDAAKAGLLMDVSDIWDENGLDEVILGADKARVDGKAFALPMSPGYFPMLYANRATLVANDALPSNGTNYQDYDEWKAAVDKVMAAGAPGLALQGGEDPWGGGQIIAQTFANNAGADAFAALQNRENPPIELMTKAMQGYEKIATSGMAIDGWQARSRDVNRSIFANGAASFLVGGSWSYANIKDENPGLDLMVMPFPNMGPNIGQNGSITDSIVISAATDVPDLAKAFYAFAASKAGMEALASGNRIPARSDLDPALVANSSEAIGAVLAAVQTVPSLFGFTQSAGGMNPFINKVSGEIIGGAKVSEQTAKDMFQAYFASR